LRNKIKPLIALTLFVGAFFFSLNVYAKPNAPLIDVSISGASLSIEVIPGDYDVEAIFIDDLRLNLYRFEGIAVMDIRDYAGDGRTITVFAVDTDGNISNAVTIENPFYSGMTGVNAVSAALPTSNQNNHLNPLTPDGQASIQDRVAESEGKDFFNFITPAGNVFHLILDHHRSRDNVYFLNPVTEIDLLPLADRPAQTVMNNESVIPEPPPTLPPVYENKTEPEEPPEPETILPPDENGGFDYMTVIIIIGAFLLGAAVILLVGKIKPKRKALISDEGYNDEAGYEDDRDFEEESSEETERNED